MTTTARLALVPRDGLFCKDGRGWHTSASGRGHALDWPWPSTILGAMRSAWGRREEARAGCLFDARDWRTRTATIRLGRTLALRRTHAARWRFEHTVWPVPEDALWLKDQDHVNRLDPQPPDVPTLGRDHDDARETLWRPRLPEAGKPLAPPRWWSAEDFVAWLSGKPVTARKDENALAPARRMQVHVGIRPEESTADEGVLFSHDVIETLEPRAEWAIGVEIELPDGSLSGTATLGSDARIARIEPLPASLFEPPAQLLEAFRSPSRGLRVVAVTPLCFERGWLPDGFAANGKEYRGRLAGLDSELILRAAFVPRPIHVSGRDMAAGGRAEADFAHGGAGRGVLLRAGWWEALRRGGCPIALARGARRADRGRFRTGRCRRMESIMRQGLDQWFARAMGRGECTPFPYQRELAVADPLPELIEVPSGTGKTAAAILAWLWRRRDLALRQKTPRRLVYCLPMRVLVEQTRECAIRWLHNLDLLAGEATFSGDRLERYEADWTQEEKVAVVTLMGGEATSDWREHPERDQILVGTQDMLLSRALNRGFAMPPQEWPVDFGFLESPELHEAIRNRAKDGHLVLVFVNQVRRALSLHARLREDAAGGPEVLLVHARMRPHDRQAVVRRLTTATPASGRVVVTTQVLEAGVDLDADALFTELCPWPSLVQRLGRLNRRGERPSVQDVQSERREAAKAVIFEPLSPARKQGESEGEYEERRKRERSLPYDAQAVEEARGILRRVETEHGGSLSPETLSKLAISLPLEGPVLRRFDLDDLFDTDPDLSGGHTEIFGICSGGAGSMRPICQSCHSPLPVSRHSNDIAALLRGDVNVGQTSADVTRRT